MTTEFAPVSVKILGKDYKISCNIDEQQSLIDSAQKLDQQMQQIRDAGKVNGSDRIAVMAALNLSHELNQVRQFNQNNSQNEHLLRIQKKIESAIESTLNL